MKLIPKGAKFCPGCLSKLSLGAAPQITFKVEEQQKNDSKQITIIGKHKKKEENALF